ncbi:hypothetical protein CAOG_03396 [Capsaspora owczarzaki ATCC 30864]|uniref:Mediator complex subunit 27 n=1 Tax=Capsaspora owczarzaki (strain ATCC 30864) TaxID=595528 RepID=A0A0D2X2E5_CAPO3|nr:hypothetical protein CAOG_03396 [Capsaspora owczarzaki ATCC 30864]KJE92419.1 hypothetical protein CAOG_003396 [Capsaspora owczarzaki ATCC 30864]|eukprot:XP_004364235.1 hypothetical protein CAOG_03396 [Capsaspora owczarzaki ATCC 30864]
MSTTAKVDDAALVRLLDAAMSELSWCRASTRRLFEDMSTGERSDEVLKLFRDGRMAIERSSAGFAQAIAALRAAGVTSLPAQRLIKQQTTRAETLLWSDAAAQDHHDAPGQVQATQLITKQMHQHGKVMHDALQRHLSPAFPQVDAAAPSAPAGAGAAGAAASSSQQMLLVDLLKNAQIAFPKLTIAPIVVKRRPAQFTPHPAPLEGDDAMSQSDQASEVVFEHGPLMLSGFQFTVRDVLKGRVFLQPLPLTLSTRASEVVALSVVVFGLDESMDVSCRPQTAPRGGPASSSMLDDSAVLHGRGSAYHMYQQLSDFATSVLPLFFEQASARSSATMPPLWRLFRWLHGYYHLTSARCGACLTHLRLDAGAGTLLPPICLMPPASSSATPHCFHPQCVSSTFTQSFLH